MFYKGVDVSTLNDVVADGGKFYDKGKQKDLLDLLQEKGVNSVRIRLWNNPFDGNKSYGGGNCGFDNCLSLCKQARQRKMDVLLCFHYSDFWADPSRQTIPKQWKNYNLTQLQEALYVYTKQTLLSLKEQGCLPQAVQIGNEITNGMLWETGHLIGSDNGERTNYENLAKMLAAASKGVREVDRNVNVVIHLEQSCNNYIYRQWLDNIVGSKVDFDTIGVSYYPNWHGTMAQLEENLTDVANRYGKEIMIVETAFPFTLETPAVQNGGQRLIINSQSVAECNFWEYEISPDGQKKYMKDLFALCKRINATGLYYWEVGWLPTPNSTWATEEGRKYLDKSEMQGGNEWCNQCLFDYDGNTLPALDVFGETEI